MMRGISRTTFPHTQEVTESLKFILILKLLLLTV